MTTNNEQYLLDAHTKAIAEAAAVRAVDRHMETCPIIRGYREMHADVYGLPGEKETNPGLMGDMADLKRSRRNLWLAIRCAWGLLVVAVGAVVAKFFRD